MIRRNKNGFADGNLSEELIEEIMSSFEDVEDIENENGSEEDEEDVVLYDSDDDVCNATHVADKVPTEANEKCIQGINAGETSDAFL